ncbi:MAG: hypothetical protein IJ523_00995 [Succinivibrionaceae bacterium]|nr:hypothetical protein [Succinivibrionaceae bacterium]
MFCRECGKEITGSQCDNPGCKKPNNLSECTAIPEDIKAVYAALLKSKQTAQTSINDTGRASSEILPNTKTVSDAKPTNEGIARTTNENDAADSNDKDLALSKILSEAGEANFSKNVNAGIKKQNKTSPQSVNVNRLKIIIPSVLILAIVTLAVFVIWQETSVQNSSSNPEKVANDSVQNDFMLSTETEKPKPAPKNFKATSDTPKNNAALAISPIKKEEKPQSQPSLSSKTGLAEEKSETSSEKSNSLAKSNSQAGFHAVIDVESLKTGNLKSLQQESKKTEVKSDIPSSVSEGEQGIPEAVHTPETKEETDYTQQPVSQDNPDKQVPSSAENPADQSVDNLAPESQTSNASGDTPTQSDSKKLSENDTNNENEKSES